MGTQKDKAERVLARIDGRSNGVASRRELLAAGLSAREIHHRLRSGALHREYPGVYRVGHRAPSIEARYHAAVKACGEGAVLSGRAAAYLWGLIRRRPTQPQVTVPRRRGISGIAIRRSQHTEATTHKAMPITTVPQTLVDLAAELSLDDLARACHEAGVKYRTTPRQVQAVLEQKPNAKGAAKLRPIFEGDARVTLSRLERHFLTRLSRAHLPLPVTNRPAAGRRVDCRWPDPPLTVELDSYTYHHSRHAWEQDRAREREARARGDEFRRYSWRDVFEEPVQMLAELRALLKAAA